MRCSIIFTGPARICDVTMSHTWISGCHGNVTEIMAVIFNLFIYLLIILLVSVVSLVSFRSFRWFRLGRFGRFACFGGFVSLVSVVSFRPFRFVVSGFSICQFMHITAYCSQTNTTDIAFSCQTRNKGSDFSLSL